MERGTDLILMTDKMQAIFDRNTGALQFADREGKPFLSGIAGTRSLEPSTVQGSLTFIAEQAFASPAGEHLFGSGEFQDGYLDIGTFPPAHAGELANLDPVSVVKQGIRYSLAQLWFDRTESRRGTISR